MEEYIKVSGKTVEDAVLEASIQLGTTRDNIEYNILEYETKGFLGLGAKKALIEARKKKSDEDIISEVFSEKKSPAPAAKKPVKEEKKAEKAAEKTKKVEKKPEKKAEKAEKKPEKADEKTIEKKAEKAAEKAVEKKAEKAAAKAEKKAEKSMEKAEKKEQKEEKAAKVPREKAPKVPADPEQAKARAVEFLQDVCKAMQIDVQIDTFFEDDTLSVELSGEDMGILIGKRGQTLDSMQYLTSLVVNKGNASYVRVKIDTENYRERRKATLENLAKNIAFKVKKTRRPVYLEPMNPYERRIIHSALQNDPFVTTHSEGEEPARKVVVTLKKRERFFDAEENDDYEEE